MMSATREEFVCPWSWTRSPGVILNVFDKTLKDANDETRWSSAWMLLYLSYYKRSRLPELIKRTLESDDSGLRENAVWMMERLPRRKVAPFIEAALRDRHVGVKRSAVWMIRLVPKRERGKLIEQAIACSGGNSGVIALAKLMIQFVPGRQRRKLLKELDFRDENSM